MTQLRSLLAPGIITPAMAAVFAAATITVGLSAGDNTISTSVEWWPLLLGVLVVVPAGAALLLNGVLIAIDNTTKRPLFNLIALTVMSVTNLAMAAGWLFMVINTADKGPALTSLAVLAPLTLLVGTIVGWRPSTPAAANDLATR